MARKLPVQVLPGCRGRITVAEMRRIASYVMDQEAVAAGVEAEIVLADAATVQELNRLYRGRDEPTDVLSFASSEGPSFQESPEERPSLGEVIVCLPVAEAQANEAGRAVAGEVAHLLVHGLLHILGYDHEEPADGELMKQREDELLSLLGYAGGYEHGH
jgi:probable rRNA maturation factor